MLRLEKRNGMFCIGLKGHYFFFGVDLVCAKSENEQDDPRSKPLSSYLFGKEDKRTSIFSEY